MLWKPGYERGPYLTLMNGLNSSSSAIVDGMVGSWLERFSYNKSYKHHIHIHTVDFGYKGLSPTRDDFSGPFVQNVRNFRQL